MRPHRSRRPHRWPGRLDGVLAQQGDVPAARASWDTVTVLGRALGQWAGPPDLQRLDHLRQRQLASRYRNAGGVLGRLPGPLGLERGYFARFPQKCVNAPCRCRSPCWNGTQDTSQVPQFARFHPVSIAEDAYS